MPGPGSTMIKQHIEEEHSQEQNRGVASNPAPMMQPANPNIPSRSQPSVNLFTRVSGNGSPQPSPQYGTQNRPVAQGTSQNDLRFSASPNSTNNPKTAIPPKPMTGATTNAPSSNNSNPPTLQVRVTSQENRTPSNKADEEMLDIPAFLRRQAN